MKSVPLYVAQLSIGDTTYRISIQRMPRKTLSMYVLEGELLIKAPLNSQLKNILDWVETKRGWIEKRILLIERMKLADNEVWYLGKKVVVYPDDQTVISTQGIQLKAGTSIDTALRKQAIETLRDLFTSSMHELGYGPKVLKFRTMTRSWGRCTSKGEITLNTRLIACDPRFIRYVCIHELVHLHHLNHSPAFWRELKSYVPDVSNVKKLSVILQKTDRFEL